MAHSKIVGGSSCGRLIQCPGSVKLAAKMPQFEGNIYTDQGTALHDAAEKLLAEFFKDPMEAVGLVVGDYTITLDDVQDKLAPAWAAWLDFATEFDIGVFAEEQEVHFSDPALDGVFGTADIIALSEDAKTVYVVDWKFGHSPVASTNNSQGMFYAAAAFEDEENADLFDEAEFVGIVIIQPALHTDAKVWFTNPRELLSFKQGVIDALEESATGNPALAEGEHCKYCPAITSCPLKLRALDRARGAPLVAANLTKILALAPDLEKLIKAARDMAQDLLEAGTPVEGWKLVDKRATRRWTEEPAALKFCKATRRLKQEDYYNMTLKSPPQLEKVCKQKNIDFNKLSGYIAAISSGATLAPEDDKRQGRVVAEKRDIPEALAKAMQSQPPLN
jgi:hypothetical protein